MVRRASFAFLLAALNSLVGIASAFLGPGPGSPVGRFAVLAMNDVYRIEGVAEGRAGDLARLRALRQDWLTGRRAPRDVRSAVRYR